jgi:hypothetical protein
MGLGLDFTFLLPASSSLSLSLSLSGTAAFLVVAGALALALLRPFAAFSSSFLALVFFFSFVVAFSATLLRLLSFLLLLLPALLLPSSSSSSDEDDDDEDDDDDDDEDDDEEEEDDGEDEDDDSFLERLALFLAAAERGRVLALARPPALRLVAALLRVARCLSLVCAAAAAATAAAATEAELGCLAGASGCFTTTAFLSWWSLTKQWRWTLRALRRRNTGTIGGRPDMNSLRAADDICETASSSSGGDMGGPAASVGDGC